LAGFLGYDAFMEFMQSRPLLRRILFGAFFMGLGLYVIFLFYFIPTDSTQSNSESFIENTIALQEQENIPILSVGKPTHLKIPKINLDSVVEFVGLTPDGTMDVPKERTNVAWFELGPRPGEDGTAVIAGHYGLNNKKKSAFDNLYKLRKGDKIYTEDDKGIITAFVVRGNRRYDPEADASSVFGSNDDKSHLNLVTCEGEWDEVSESYPTRLVVFTDKE